MLTRCTDIDDHLLDIFHPFVITGVHRRLHVRKRLLGLAAPLTPTAVTPVMIRSR